MIGIFKLSLFIAFRLIVLKSSYLNWSDSITLAAKIYTNEIRKQPVRKQGLKAEILFNK